MLKLNWRTICLAAIFLIIACDQNPKELPYLGPLQVDGSDTTYYQIPDFEVIDQDSNIVTRRTLAGDIFVADFFFTSCPTICPKMTKQMNRVYEKFGEDAGLQLVSYTIDNKHDTVPVLKAYAEKLDIQDNASWHFVWGPREEIFDLAGNFFQTAYADSTEPGGFVHSGQFALVDASGHIRGFYNGTDAEEVDELMGDIELLLNASKY